MTQKSLRVKLLAYTPNPDKLVASGAKLCYSYSGITEIMDNLTDEKVDNFISDLVSIGHESPVEHVTFTFAVEGVSRVLTHQLVRHRLASYSQVSQRYVSHDQFEYIVPEKINNNHVAKDIYIEHMKEDQRVYDVITGLLYNDLLREEMPRILTDGELALYREHGCNVFEGSRKKDMLKLEDKLYKEAIEEARYVLPNACETKIMITMNARTLLNFFSLRCCNRAQKEIRDLANEMLIEVKKVAPTLFKRAGASCTHGNCKEGNMTCGNPIKETMGVINNG